MRFLSILFLALLGGSSLSAATLKPVVRVTPVDLEVTPDAGDMTLDLKTIFAIDGVDGPIARYDTVVGQINVELFDTEAPLSVAAGFGAIAGRSLAGRVDSEGLRRAFAGLIVVAAAYTAIRSGAALAG